MAMRTDLIKYIRTDKNGTKIYHDYTCPRCGGMGEAAKWQFTGLVCFACGGTGERVRPKVVKEYTDEYWEKLQARRRARDEKYREEHAEEIAREQEEAARREVEHKREAFKRDSHEFGCNDDGVGYVLLGDTYPAKNEIKANGGRWIARTWVCPVALKIKGVSAVRIDLNEFINEYGYISHESAQDLIFCIGQRGMSYEEAVETVHEWERGV